MFPLLHQEALMTLFTFPFLDADERGCLASYPRSSALVRVP